MQFDEFELESGGLHELEATERIIVERRQMIDPSSGCPTSPSTRRAKTHARDGRRYAGSPEVEHEGRAPLSASSFRPDTKIAGPQFAALVASSSFSPAIHCVVL